MGLLVGVSFFVACFFAVSGALKWFMISTFSDLILRVALGYILSVPFGTTGIWLSWPIGWSMGTVLSLLFYAKGVWKPQKKNTLKCERVVLRGV